MMPSQSDILMRETLRLAEQGRGRVSPRPLVGSLVVQQGVIVGRGFYHEPEPAHAEVWALREAGPRARGATLYVNLEPCSHHGRTPPCTEAIIAAGIHRVVASIRDPNPQVNGRGFEQLRAAGIEVLTDVLAVEGVKLNEVFIVNQLEHRPFVHLKLALSLDGKIATRTGHSQWLTGTAARLAGQNLRHRYDAIAVGIGTVLADDPQLTDRTGQYRHRPLARVVFGSMRTRLPRTRQLVQTAHRIPTWLVTVEAAGDADYLAELEEQGVRLLRVAADAHGRPRLDQALAGLYAEGVASLLVEGGSTLAGAFVDNRLVDKVTGFIAPRIIGGSGALSAVGGRGASTLDDTLDLAEVTAEPAGSDWAITGYAGQTIKQVIADAQRATPQMATS